MFIVMDIYDMYKSGMSITEISKDTGIPISTLRFRFKKKNILRSRADGVRLAAKKGKLGHSKRKGFKASEETKQKIREARLKHGEINAKGYTINSKGYIVFTRGEYKGRFEHSVIMEKHIGRRLKRNECVHHINHIRDDNRPENLQLMTLSEHAKLHRLLDENNRKRDEKGRYI